MRIVLLGDSHLARIRRDLPHLGADVLNAAVGGATVLDLGGQAASASIRPDDVVVMSVGTNDAAPWKAVPPETFRSALEQFLDTYATHRQVVLLPPGVIESRLHGTPDRTNAVLDEYRASVSAVAAAAGAVVVDPRAVLFELGSSAFDSDGLHLSGTGYRALLPALRRAVESSRAVLRGDAASHDDG